MKKFGMLMVLGVCCLLVGSLQAGMVLRDDFDGDGFSNAGIGGGMANNTIDSPAKWEDDGTWRFVNNNVHNANRAIGYSTNNFQSANGFTLVVYYYFSTGNLIQNQFSFGLISTNTVMSSYADWNPFGTTANLYSIGVNLTTQGGTRGLNFTDGTVTNLDPATFVASSVTPVVISVLPDGLGGADWSYSINGNHEASGNIAVFDFTKSYQFASFGRDNEYTRWIESVILYEGPAAGENLVPIVFDQDATAFPEHSKDITLVGLDPEGSNLTWSVVNEPANGMLTGAGPVMTYTATNGYHGADSFTFRANDGDTYSAPATVSITVTNQVPTANAQNNVQVPFDTATAITLTGNDTDSGPSNLTYSVVDTPTNGALSGDAPDLTYTPTNGYLGADSFTFRVNDGYDDSAQATVTITVTNEAPTADAKSLFALMNTPISVVLTGSDADGPSNLTYSVTSQPTYGMLSGVETNLTYTPTNGYTGNDSFTYSVNDGLDDSEPATVSIVVDDPIVNYQHTAGSTNPLSTAIGVASSAAFGGSLYGVIASSVDQLSAARGEGLPDIAEQTYNYYFVYTVESLNGAKIAYESLAIDVAAKSLERDFQLSYIIDGGTETFLNAWSDVPRNITGTDASVPYDFDDFTTSEPVEFRVYWGGSTSDGTKARVYVDDFFLNGSVIPSGMIFVVR